MPLVLAIGDPRHRTGGHPTGIDATQPPPSFSQTTTRCSSSPMVWFPTPAETGSGRTSTTSMSGVVSVTRRGATYMLLRSAADLIDQIALLIMLLILLPPVRQVRAGCEH